MRPRQFLALDSWKLLFRSIVDQRVSRPIILILLAAGCLVALSLIRLQHDQVDEVTIAVAQQPVFALVFIAQQYDFFRDEGLNVTIRTHLLGKDALGEVTSGTADLATVFDIPFLTSLCEGNEISAVTMLHTSTTNHAVIGLRSSDIFKPTDLRGKRIAFAKGTSTDYLLAVYLTELGIPEETVQSIDMPPDEMLPALQQGKVDAAVVFSPHRQAIQRALPPDSLSLFTTSSYAESSLLAAKSEYVTAEPAVIAKTLRALKRAEMFVEEHPAEAIASVDEWLAGYEAASVNDDWHAIQFQLGLSNSLLLNLTREARFLHRQQYAGKDIPDIRASLSLTGLVNVWPERATVY